MKLMPNLALILFAVGLSSFFLLVRYYVPSNPFNSLVPSAWIITKVGGFYYVQNIPFVFAKHSRTTPRPVGNSNVQLDNYLNKYLLIDGQGPKTRDELPKYLRDKQCIMDECIYFSEDKNLKLQTVDIFNVKFLNE